ncbi:MAG: hypothetical protein COA52_01165 [Hyphomicrobiales bacterium]|nr:MAG: hypothetical protein COA52_00075 [Hyphomicrobiales bacterium]PCJ96847.1 MAG: hypothetical protein COA52_01165 [Hyphomicrobiales bacterium]
MKPYIHAKNSVRRYGGVPEDYIHIHNWFDSTKAAYPSVKHRAILHNSFGIFLAEQLFGVTMENSDGKIISVRDIAEDHVKEDFGGKIPTIAEWLDDMPEKSWMKGYGQKRFAEKEEMYHD